MSKLEYDWQQYKLRWIHKILDMDRDIFHWCMLYCWGILDLLNIQGGSLEELRYKWASKNMRVIHWYLGTEKIGRKVMDYKGHDKYLVLEESQGLIKDK